MNAALSGECRINDGRKAEAIACRRAFRRCRARSAKACAGLHPERAPICVQARAKTFSLAAIPQATGRPLGLTARPRSPLSPSGVPSSAVHRHSNRSKGLFPLAGFLGRFLARGGDRLMDQEI